MMRFVSSFAILFAAALLMVPAASVAAEFFVAPNGDDAAAGSAAAPFATLERAQRAVRELKKADSADKSATVTIAEGVYRLSQTLGFGPEDSGSQGSPVVWRAAPGATVVLSGGRPVTGWRTTTVAGRAAWQAEAPQSLLPQGLRDLYVDGQRRKRACSAPKVPAGMLRDAEGKPVGISIDDPAVAHFARPTDMQVRQQVSWRHYILAVQSVKEDGAGRTEILLKDTPEWLAPTFVGFKSFAPVVLDNAIELMDEPGEWYFDKSTGKLFYLPLPGEKPDEIHAVVPVLDRLMAVVGGAAGGHLVHDIVFEGLTFADAAWAGPNDDGWFGYDPGFIVKGKGLAGGMSFANVYATDACRLAFRRNTFTRLGGVGLHLNQVDDSQAVGNLFADISAEGLGLGAVLDPPRAPKSLTVENNLFYRTNQDYRMGPALLTGKLLQAAIHHNHVCETPYIGILVNKIFGKPPAEFGKLDVRWNRIEGTMGPTHDGGAFYTWTDGSSDGSQCVFSDNYISGVFSRDSQGVYLDNDCRYWTVERNVIECTLGLWYLVKGSHHALRDNFTDNAASRRMDLHEPAEIVEENTTVDPRRQWAAHGAAKAVIEQAGLEAAYRGLLARIPAAGASKEPPKVAIRAATEVGLLKNLRLQGSVQDSGGSQGRVHFCWSKASGPGDVNFFGQQTRALDIAAAFSAPGDYVLRLAATDMQREASAEVKVVVLPADKGTELAAGLAEGSYTASAVNSPSESPAKAFDGNPGTFWYPGFPGVGWLQVDLGSAAKIARVEMDVRKDADHDNSRFEFEVLASNDPQFKSFTTVAQQGLDADPNRGGVWTANFSGSQSYRYIRWWKRDGFDGVVPGLRVFGQRE